MVSVKVEALQKKAQSVRIIELSETLMRWAQNLTVADNLKNLGESKRLKSRRGFGLQRC